MIGDSPREGAKSAVTGFIEGVFQENNERSFNNRLGGQSIATCSDVPQVMRQRAAQKGNLRSNAQQVVQTQSGAAVDNTSYADEGQARAYYGGPSGVEAPPQYIEISPAQQDTVYVPSYNPQTVYGDDVPVYPSYSYQPGGYSTGEIITAGAVTFGAGILIGTLLENHHHDRGYNNPPPPPGGGWHSWGMKWGGRGAGGGQQQPAVIHNNSTYVSNSTTVINRYTTNNVHTTNNINNSRTTINNVNDSRNEVVQNRDVGNRTVNNPPRPAANAIPAATPHGATPMPHFGNVPPQETARMQQARPPAHAPDNPQRPNATTPHPAMPYTPPAHASVAEPNRAARPMPTAQPQTREAVRPMPPRVTPAAPHASAPRVEARPAMPPREVPHPAAAPRVEAAPRPAPPQRPNAVAPPAHPAHPAAPEKKDKHDQNEHA